MPRRAIRSLLIANRGEIAVRVIRACRELGISPIAVYSEADRRSVHVALADSAVCLGPAAATESYLSIDRVLEAARQSGADSIHPGYGFLSENAEFARRVQDAGLIWIGPPPSAMELLGDKIAAKTRAAAAGVPVVPGYHGSDQSAKRLAAEAKQMGAPVLIKAAAGGGGRGQRVVTSLAGFNAALDEAKREARASFGDDRMLIERFVERPRHIEVQVFGDRHGNVISLFERDCSIQRRRQKIIEESPSPGMTPILRKRISEAAVDAARAAGYVGAGTVEFLVDAAGSGEPSFYFLEVNTRLQVEHPVTEMLTGLDLVKWQIAVAQGAALPLSQECVSARGHAMELRIYAEDPSTGFLPSVGAITTWIAPSGPGIRIDSGVEAGSEVSPYYDPLLAKLIVSGHDRSETISRARAALRGFHVLGMRTNIAYLLDILEHPMFRAGDFTIRFLDEQFAQWSASHRAPMDVLLAVVAERITGSRRGTERARSQFEVESNSVADPWVSTNRWRNAR
jgi:3-methylcrotonyl-CoA carboxylase alpha subunit